MEFEWTEGNYVSRTHVMTRIVIRVGRRSLRAVVAMRGYRDYDWRKEALRILRISRDPAAGKALARVFGPDWRALSDPGPGGFDGYLIKIGGEK